MILKLFQVGDTAFYGSKCFSAVNQGLSAQHLLSVSIVLPSHCRPGAPWDEQLVRCEAEVNRRPKSQWPMSYKGQLALNWCLKTSDLFAKEGECLGQEQQMY